jgi:hypothetical protein
MRLAKSLSLMAGLLAVAVCAGTGSALAHDYDHGWKHKHKHHHVPPGHVYYVERPIVVERPVVYARPRPLYPEPMYYGPPAPSLNINIPLR